MAYYDRIQTGAEHPNSWYIQRKRCYERIMTTRKPPTPKTIEKYGIQFDGQNRVIIPPDLRKPNLKVAIAPKVMNADESVKWLLENYNKDARPDIIKKYKQIGTIVDLAGGDRNNIAPTLEKPDELLEALTKAYTNVETLKQKWQTASTHATYVPMDLSPEAVRKYGIIFNNLKNKSKEAVTERRKEEKVYRWDKILEAVEKTFGKDSLENFFFKMYDEIPIRTEFSHDIPVVQKVEDAPKEGNFVLNLGGDVIELHLREWKTKSSKYPDDVVYRFSPELAKLFKPRALLLPVKEWGKWVKESLERSGFPKFPYGTDDYAIKDIASGLRKTIATFRNSPLNTTGKPKGAELAKLMLHDLATSEGTYQHTSFME